MKIFKQTLCIALLISSAINLEAQVTIGSGIAPTRAALLEIKEKQTQNANNVGDTESATSGGLLLPRVKLVSTSTLEPFIPTTDPDWDGGTKEKELKLSLVGLMVYNIKSDGTNLYPGIYSWNGGAWVTSQANPSKLSIAKQPQYFSFYETGIAADKPMEALQFLVNSGTEINGDPIPVSYQWYQMVGSNRNARVGKELTSASDKTNGSQTFAFTPKNLLKGSTINANNTGFYKFYCGYR